MGVEPVRLLVPAVASRRPHRSRLPRAHRGHELGEHFSAHFEDADGAAPQTLDRSDDVVGLGLHQVDHRPRAEIGVGAVHEEQVGEVGHRESQVGLGGAGPLVVQCHSVTPGDRHAAGKTGRGKARGEDQNVDRTWAGIGLDSSGPDTDDRVGGHGDIRTLQALVVAVRDEDPFASDPVVRSECCTQVWITHCVPQHDPVDQCQRGEHSGPAPEEHAEELEVEPHQLSGGAPEQRIAPVHRADAGTVRTVRFREHERRGALEDGEVFDLLCDGRDHLDGAGPRADDGDTFPGEIDIVPPSRGVKGRAGERLQAVDVGNDRDVELARRTDHNLRVHPGSVGQLEFPPVVAPRRRRDAHTQTEPFGDSGLVDAALEVVTDLRTGREAPRPIDLLGKGKAVDMGRCVAGGTRVRVGLPCTPDGVSLVVDHEVALTGSLQFQSHCDAGESGSDDGSPDRFMRLRMASSAHPGTTPPSSAVMSSAVSRSRCPMSRSSPPVIASGTSSRHSDPTTVPSRSKTGEFTESGR